MRGRKALVLALLERGPATTGDVRRQCNCASSAQALGSLHWLRECGAIKGRTVLLHDSPTDSRTTTLWSIA